MQHEHEIDRAIRRLTAPMDKDRLALTNAHLQKANYLHHEDLTKTQVSFQDNLPENASILVLVKYPEFASISSCRYSTFLPGRVRLTPEQLESTGSELLMGLLRDEKHQRRAKKAVAPLEAGVTHVLDLSPSYDEEDFTIALQRLTITEGIKLWHRSMAFGVSPLAVAAHDDVCCCLLPVHEKYPLQMPPESAQMMDVGGEVCIFDTKKWPIDEYYNIDDFCQTRWAACTQRLFRSIAKPAGQKDLLIDSAPRMWTLVGLFSKLEMTNYDLLRDEVTAWFNADLNYLFVELCPEETLRVGLTLKIPLLSEPAFRILANERALEVAGGQPRFQPTRTIFGRRCSHFTDDTESISRIVDHAGTAMADRYKAALDTVFSDDLLDRLDIYEWKELRALHEIIPKASSKSLPLPVRLHYDKMMGNARAAVRQAIDEVFHGGGVHLPDNIAYSPLLGRSWQGKSLSCLEAEIVDSKRLYTVPKRELSGSQSFGAIWKNLLNQHQRALCPLFWQSFRNVTMKYMMDKFFATDVATDFILQFAKAQREGEILSAWSSIDFAADLSGYFRSLFQHVEDALRAFATRLVDRDAEAFTYTATPHLLLNLNDEEMNFLRLADDETRFQADVPEADMGPSGPGPAFHTGHSVTSALNLDLENLALESSVGGDDDDDDGASTVVGSLVAQDGISTVFDRRRVLAAAAASSSASERFTDEDGMSVEYADAEYAVPAAHQSRGQVLADIVEEGESGEEDLAFELSDEEEEDDDNDLNMEDVSGGAVDGKDDGSKGGDGDEDEDDFELVQMAECR